MLSLNQARRMRAGEGEPIPDVFETLRAGGVRFRRGEVAIVAAPPGCGKSAFALTLALRARVPTLYLAMDGDSRTMEIRAIAMLTKMNTTDVEVMLDDEEFVAAALAPAAHIEFSFATSLEMQDIAEIAAAFGDKHGEHPHLVVIDNTSDVAYPKLDEFGGLRKTVSDLTDLAKLTRSAVVALHHVTGEWERDYTQPIPMAGLNGKIGKKPGLVLTMTRSLVGDQLFLSPVKNRHAAPDPSGYRRLALWADLARMQIGDRAAW